MSLGTVTQLRAVANERVWQRTLKFKLRTLKIFRSAFLRQNQRTLENF